jgi:hypothetical protein
MADLYDPDAKTHDVVFVVVGAAWSSPCQSTLDTVKTSTKRIATLAVLGEGATPGSPATLTDLSTFRTKNAFATTVLDAGYQIFGAYFDAAAVPFIMVLDARTMEIAAAGTGAVTNVSDIDTLVTQITSRAAAY